MNLGEDFWAGLLAGIALSLLVVVLAGCGDISFIDVDVPDEVEVGVDGDSVADELHEVLMPEFKKVNGQTFVYWGDWCMAIDPNAPYPDKFTPMDEYDGYRGELSGAELFHCSED